MPTMYIIYKRHRGKESIVGVCSYVDYDSKRRNLNENAKYAVYPELDQLKIQKRNLEDKLKELSLDKFVIGNVIKNVPNDLKQIFVDNCKNVFKKANREVLKELDKIKKNLSEVEERIENFEYPVYYGVEVKKI